MLENIIPSAVHSTNLHIHICESAALQRTFPIHGHTFIFDDSNVKLRQTFAGHLSDRYAEKSVPGLFIFSHNGFYCC